jgi:hypothetical protein
VATLLQAFVLEEEGRVDEAFELMRADLDEKLRSVLADASELSWSQLNAAVLMIIQFCQRVSSRSTDSRSHEKLWFALLDALVNFARNFFNVNLWSS